VFEEATPTAPGRPDPTDPGDAADLSIVGYGFGSPARHNRIGSARRSRQG